jgi:PAS domain S-box-containing protein
METNYSEFVEGFPGLIVTMNIAGNVELFSGEVLEYFGKTREELRTWQMNDAVHPDDLPRVISAFTESVASGKPYSVEHRCRRADGIYRWFRARALAAHDENDQITGWYVVLTDIDDLKCAEAERVEREDALNVARSELAHMARVTRGDTVRLQQLMLNLLRNAGISSTTARNSSTRPLVFVVEDDAPVRESLELLIRSEGWEPVIFDSSERFLAHDPVDAPSCLILDVNLHDLNGLDLQKRVNDMPIIFITGREDVPTTVKAMKAGAVEFLAKPSSNDVLIRAIENAIESSQSARRSKVALRAISERHNSLTNRERQVMQLVVAGTLNKRIGAQLGISEITVKAHRGHMMRKMKAGSLADLVRMASALIAASIG